MLKRIRAGIYILTSVRSSRILVYSTFILNLRTSDKLQLEPQKLKCNGSLLLHLLTLMSHSSKLVPSLGVDAKRDQVIELVVSS